jgi:endoglucanase
MQPSYVTSSRTSVWILLRQRLAWRHLGLLKLGAVAAAALCAAVLLLSYPTCSADGEEIAPLRGVNLPSAAFGASSGVRAYGYEYIYPDRESIDYFAGKGMNAIRLPFRWENLQPLAKSSLDPDELARIDGVVDLAAEKGMFIVIEPHNGGRYFGKVLGRELGTDALADLWQRLADHFKPNPKVAFGLMNEPYDMPTRDVFNMSQAAIDAIRSTGARNLILVDGNNWSAARTWLAVGNDILRGLWDPVGRLLLSPHQYLDVDGSGTHADCVSSTIGAERLREITEWARGTRQRLVLGEFGGGANDVCEAAVKGMLDYMDANGDVWTGWIWFAAGPWWGDYFQSIEPHDGMHRPQMKWLEPHLSK